MDWIGTALSALGGIMTIAAMVGGYLYKELKEADKEQAKELNTFKQHVAGSYIPRHEVSMMVQEMKQEVKAEIRSSADSIKELIEAKLGR